MNRKVVLSILFLAGLLHAQNGQQPGSRPGWPCVPGRAVDPAYLEVSEGTGGQLFLFQRNEVAQSTMVMTANHTHPATVLRAVGNLSGERDFEFAVDSGMQSILVLASIQCRNAVRLSRPSGAELTQSNSVQFVELQAGRIQRVDLPEPGMWKVRLAGTGLFVLSVLTKAEVSLAGVGFSEASDGSGGEGQPATPLKDPVLGVPQRLEARLGGQVSNVRFQVVGPAGDPIASLDATGPAANGTYSSTIVPSVERFRIRVTGTDAGGWPFQRTYPVLFRARQPK